jgi:hypothetical protein
MQYTTASEFKFPGKELEPIPRDNLVQQVFEIIDSSDKELTSLTTNVRSFEWAEINIRKSEFKSEFKSLSPRITKAFLVIYFQAWKKTEYRGYTVK